MKMTAYLILLHFTIVSTLKTEENSIRSFVSEFFSKNFTEDPLLDITPLGGITNYNFRVKVGKEQFFIRLGYKDPAFLGIDRKREFLIYELIKNEHITPELIYFDCITGNLISSFIHGTSYGKRNGKWLYERDESLSNMIELIKKYHRISNPMETEIEYPFEIINQYLDKAKLISSKLPSNINEALHLISLIRSILPPSPKVLCHQDLFSDNFIYDGKNLYLVDWEYGHWSDPLYDLSSLCVQQEFDDEEKEMALSLYFNECTQTQRIHLEMMCMLFSMRCALWCFNQNCMVTDKNFDYNHLGYFFYDSFFKSYEWLSRNELKS